MGTEAVWVPMVMSAVAAGASHYNTQQTLKKQDNELARQIAMQGQRQREADARVNEAILEQQQSNPEAERKASLEQYVEQLRRTQGNAAQGLGQVGAISERFAQDAAAAAGQVQQTGERTADIMSRIDAPLRQRQNEGIRFGRLGSEIGRVGLLSDSDRYIGELRMRGVRRNPWIDLGAGLLGGAAGAMASGGWGQAAAQAAGGTFGTLPGGEFSGLYDTDYAQGGGTFGTLGYRKRGQLYGGA
ncbi:hypothetical protein CO610_07440 [Lysobacteraceae bacterium NML95-0200]|nr:hypothetical protein CO610_07440 [Xanthomonadaceae bacterium NML95-0200]